MKLRIGWLRRIGQATATLALAAGCGWLGVAVPAAGAPAADAAAPSILLTASTRSELRDTFRDDVSGVPGVLAIADVGRQRVYFTHSWDAAGAVVDHARPGFFFALDALVFDPSSYSALLGAEAGQALADLGDGDVLLGETSAQVRRLGAGSTLELVDGTRLTVRAIVADDLIQNREIALAQPGFATSDNPGRRSLLIRYSGPEDTIEAQMLALLPPETRLRLRALEASEFLRSPAAILPQAQMKLALGEFAYRPTEGRTIERDPRWVEENLINASVPLLGRLRCHRLVVAALQGAMKELIDRDLEFLIEADAFQGCDNPRLIAVGRGFSRHAWGGAVDLNYSDDATVRANAQDPRLVEIMDRWGFTSGHLWHNPDPGHFEYVGPPRDLIPIGPGG